MTNEEIKKGLTLCVDSICDDCPYCDTKNCYNQIKTEARELIIEQEKEIAQLKTENVRLAAKLGQVLLSINTVKEMVAMCNIYKQQKDAVQDFVEKAKSKSETFLVAKGDGVYGEKLYVSVEQIDKLLEDMNDGND